MKEKESGAKSIRLGEVMAVFCEFLTRFFARDHTSIGTHRDPRRSSIPVYKWQKTSAASK